MLNFVMGGMSLAKGILGSRSAKSAAKAKARSIRAMANYNARVKEMEAESILDTSRAETARAYKAKRRALARQKAVTTKTGAVSTEGTGLNNLLENAVEIELGIQNERRNRLIEVDYAKQLAKTTRYQGEVQARQAIADGKLASQQALMSGLMGAASGFGKGMTALGAASGAGKELTFTQKILS